MAKRKRCGQMQKRNLPAIRIDKRDDHQRVDDAPQMIKRVALNRLAMNAELTQISAAEKDWIALEMGMNQMVLLGPEIGLKFLVPKLPVLRSWIEQVRDQWAVLIARLRDRDALEEARALDAKRGGRVEAWLNILRQMEAGEVNEGWAALISLAATPFPFKEDLEQWFEGQKAQAKTESADQARLAEKLANLSPAQRIAGLLKWAIQQVIDHADKPLTQKPAAELLCDRLANGAQAGTLTAEERSLYQDLKTRLAGDHARKRIDDLMDDTVLAIPWKSPTIRL